MSSKSPTNCKFCGRILTSEMIVGRTVVCKNCFGTFDIPKKMSALQKSSIALAAFLGFTILAWFIFNQTRGYESRFASLGETDMRQQLKSCEDNECKIAGYGRLYQIDPQNLIYAANYAFRLTNGKQFEKAQPIYDTLIGQGHGTVDLLAYTARNLVGLGRDLDAVKWYEVALSIQPTLIDVTQELALTLTRLNQRDSAISILKAFIQEFPRSRIELDGNLKTLLATQAQNPEKSKTSPEGYLKLYTKRGGHHYMVALLGSGIEVFLVDTGATYVTMPTDFFNQHLKEQAKNQKPQKLAIADGSIIEANEFVIPQMHLGPFALENVKAVHCNNCALLLGRSALKHFRIETQPKGQLEVMLLKPNRDI